jgi:hypothetical protein
MATPQFTDSAGGAHGRVIIIEGEAYIYDTPILVRTPESVPAVFATRWADHFIAKLDSKFFPGWARVLDTQEHFNTRLADKAVARYPAYLNPAQSTRRERPVSVSLRAQNVKLHAAYQTMKDAIDFLQFAGRTLFEDNVQLKRPKYRAGEALPLSVTGDYLEQLLGAAVRQWFFLGQTAKFQRYFWQTDYLEGKWPPDPAFLAAGNHWTVARQFLYRTVQGGCNLLNKMATARVESRLADLLRDNLQAPYLAPPDSFVAFQVIEGTPSIRSYIGFTPP